MDDIHEVVLGGVASPIGWWVTFIESPISEVEAWLADEWFRDRPFTATSAGSYPDCLEQLEPLESPWTKHLLVEHGRWTMHVSNSLLGGDPSAPGPALSTLLGVRVVVAGHSPRHGPGHAGTALWLLGPDGEPPLHYVRTIQVDCVDGRWSWYESGEPLPFERVDRYSARLKRNRLTRDMLIQYLGRFEIWPDVRTSFGASRLLAGESTNGRSIARSALRSELGLD